MFTREKAARIILERLKELEGYRDINLQAITSSEAKAKIQFKKDTYELNLKCLKVITDKTIQ